MSSAIEKLGEDDDGQTIQPMRPSRKRPAKRTSTGNQYSTLEIEETSEDSDFSDEIPALQSDSDSESVSDRDKQMTNKEVVQSIMQATLLLIPYSFQLTSLLPRKTVAERGPAAHSLRTKKKVLVSKVVHQPPLPFNPSELVKKETMMTLILPNCSQCTHQRFQHAL
jgi:hypothetical protein